MHLRNGGCVSCLLNAYCLAELVESLESKVFSPGWWAWKTPSRQRTAYVASLISAGAAEALAPQMQQWRARASARAGALALLQPPQKHCCSFSGLENPILGSMLQPSLAGKPCKAYLPIGR
eukprot:jgi/Botrbrau1/822/Bobra.0352s0019.1